MNTGPGSSETVRLTVAQATVRFLSMQYSERDGIEQKLFAGCFGIFGHGNVAGLGQALLQSELEEPEALPYVLGRNEQAMVHTAVAYARMRDRLQTWAVSASVGPGSTNMVTGAALATINRIPVLLLPADTFADRSASPLLQELELPYAGDVTVNDVFRPVSKYFDRIWRPEQLPAALISAMRVLTDPAETGAVTVCFPQDVQAQAHDWPTSLFARRVWHVARPLPETRALEEAVELIRSARRPLVVAGGGVGYSGAHDALAAFCDGHRHPRGPEPGRQGVAPVRPPAVPRRPRVHGHDGRQRHRPRRRRGDRDRHALLRLHHGQPHRVPGPGRALREHQRGADRRRQARRRRRRRGRPGDPGVADQGARRTTRCRRSTSTSTPHSRPPGSPPSTRPTTRSAMAEDGRFTQSQVLGLVNDLSDPRDVVVCAAGSMPGDLHKLWQVRDAMGYHVEYGYSCMGYEIAGGLGVRMACPDRDVFVMVGDGSYLMMATELVTAVQEGIKVIVVLVQNHGFASIGALSESLGSQRFGTSYRYRSESGRLDGEPLPVDLAANAASLGMHVVRPTTPDELATAIRDAKAATTGTVIHVETDPLQHAPDSESWWDVPVSETSTLESTQAARTTYDQHKATQRPLLEPSDTTHPGASS